MAISGVGGGLDWAAIRALQSYSSPQASGGAAPVGGGQASKDQFSSDLSGLFDAVKSGDMTAAQSALGTLVLDGQGLYSPASKPGHGKSPVQDDFKALFDAVQKGDKDAAQAALQKLLADIKQRGGHHGHHGHGGGAAAPDSSTANDTNATNPASPTLASPDPDHDGD